VRTRLAVHSGMIRTVYIVENKTVLKIFSPDFIEFAPSNKQYVASRPRATHGRLLPAISARALTSDTG